MKGRYTAQELAELDISAWKEILEQGDQRLRVRALVADIVSGLVAEVCTQTGASAKVTVQVDWGHEYNWETVRMEATLGDVFGQMTVKERPFWILSDTGEITEDEPEIVWVKDGRLEGILYGRHVIEK